MEISNGIIFTAPNLTILDEVDFDEQTTDISYGRYPNGIGQFTRMTPSFALENSDGIQHIPNSGVNTPTGVELIHTYPNPFNTSTTIGFQIPVPGEVILSIYSSLGQCVSIPVRGKLSVGGHKVVWDGTDMRGAKVNSGVYFCVLRSCQQEKILKFVALH